MCNIAPNSGLELVSADESTSAANTWYTITGLRIDKPTRPGLYIHNHKKVIIK